MSDSADHINAQDAQRTVRNISALVVASVFSKGILFVWQIVLGAWLGPADYGIYGTVLGLLAIGASLAGFGIGLIAIREVAAHPEQAGEYAAAMLVVQTVTSGIAYVGMVLAALLAGYSDLIIAYTAIAGLSILVDTGGNIAHDLLIAQERMVVTSSIDSLNIVLRVGLAAVVVGAGGGLFGLYLVTIATGLLRLSLFWAVQWHSGLRLVWPVQRRLLMPMLVNAAPLAMSAVLFLAYQHADKLMVTAIIGERQTGYITPAFTINFGVIDILSTTVMVAMFPLLSRYFNSDTPQMFGFLVEKLARFMLILALPITLVLSIFSDEVIAFIFRSGEFEPTGGILRILIWYTLLAIVASVFSQALLTQNRQRITLLVRGASLLLNIALNTILLLHFRDPRAAAMASVGAEALALLLLVRAFRAEGFSLARVLLRSSRVLLLGAVVALVMLVLGDSATLLGISVGLSIYGISVIYGNVLGSDDWDLIYRLIAALPGGTIIRRYWQRETVINW